MENAELQNIESRLLMEAIFLRYGYDFRQYQPASIMKVFSQHAHEHGYRGIASLIPDVLADRKAFERLFLNIPVSVTDMFRDPYLYAQLRERVLPVLGTYPYLNVWVAGCATGEEAYSIAIQLREADLYRRSQIYATDINDHTLRQAAKGIYQLKDMRRYTLNYNQAGGSGSLGDYYHARYEAAKIDAELKRQITFARHNLVSDGVFSEMHLVMCRNVLIYFKRELQFKVLRLLTDSLCHNGFLCLGEHESLEFTPVRQEYELIDSHAKIYRKRITLD